MPANPFAPGGAAGGASVVGDLLKTSMGAGLPLPSFTSNSSARSGDAFQYGSATGDNFSVNFGSGVLQGGGVPSWVWIAAAIAAGVWAWKRSH